MGEFTPRLDVLRGHRAEVLAASCALNVLSLALPIAILQVYDRVIPNAAGKTLALLALALGVVLALDLGLSLGRAYITSWTGAKIQHRLACSAFDRIFSADLRAFEDHAPGVHLQRLRAVDGVKSFYAGQSLLLVVDLPFALVFFTLIGLIAGPLVLVPVFIMVFLGMSAASAGRQLDRALALRRENDDRRNNFMIEVLRCMTTVKALGAELLMLRRYERLQGGSAGASFRVAGASAWARDAGYVFSQVTAIAVGSLGSILVIDGKLTVGGLAACTLLASRSAQPMMRALGTWSQFQNARVARNRVREIMSMPGEAVAPAPGSGRIEGKIDVDGVSFSYGEESAPLLHDLNLRVEAGETVAITGANGSGKSTLLGLVSGVLVPNAGCVLIDGIDARAHIPENLRSQMVYLPQRALMFQGTLLENLTMFRGERHLDKAMQIAEQLGLHEAIGRMPKGYETRIEHASNDGLSGGVRQRIALVRALALVDEPRLILFDEANAHLDEQSDRRLLDLLKEYQGRSTIIMVSHRPSFVSIANRVFVIRDHGLHQPTATVREALEALKREFVA